MKRQLDRLKGKRLVTGDPNLMTKDEICINATPNGVEVKEIGTDGKIKDLAGSEGDSSISENKKYFKAIKTYDTSISLNEVMGPVPCYQIWNQSTFIYSTENNIKDFIPTGLLQTTNIPYYIIDFNSKSVKVSIDREVGQLLVSRLNDYPYEVAKNAAIESGIQMDEEQLNQAYNQIKEAFDSTFVEITKEEYLEIHNQCMAGTWVPEWEK